MTIRFFCDCGKRLEVSDSAGGRTLRCPDCEAEIVVPMAAKMAAPFDSHADVPREEGYPGAHRRSDLRLQSRGTKASRKAILSLIFGLLSFCANLITALPAVILGLLSLREIQHSQGRLTGKGLAIAGILTAIAGILFSTAGGVGFYFIATKVRDSLYEDADLMNTRKDMEALAQGLIEYSRNFGGFPPSTFRQSSAPVDPRNANSGLSWRVAILPFIGEEDLYKEFDLHQPWDSPNNLKLLARMPKIYAHPRADQAKTESGLTYYRGFVGPGAVFDPALAGPMDLSLRRVGARLADFTDGTSNTILIAEAAEPVEWTRPDDLPFAANQPLPKLGGFFSMGFNIATADGKVHLIRHDAQESALRGLITSNGGESINWRDLE